MPSNHFILCCCLLLLPSVFPSISVFSNESALRIRWSKDWSFSFSISPSNEYSGLISFRVDWFHLLAVLGTLKSPPAQFENINSLVPSLPYGPTLTCLLERTIALTIQTFVGKMMSLIFNALSGFVIAFFPRSKHLLILWLQSPSAVILEPKKIECVTVSTFSPSICSVFRTWLSPLIYFYLSKCASMRNFKLSLQLENHPHL